MISIKALKALAASGATADMIIAVVEADLSVYEERRRIDADRKRKERASKDVPGRPVQARTSKDVLGRPRTEPQPLEAAPAVQPTSSDEIELVLPTEAATEPAKKKGPHTPKEKTLTPSQRSSRPRAGTRLSEDWKPSPEDLSTAKKHLAIPQIPIEVTKFRNYWVARSGAGATKMDWPRTFENWCISAAERGPKNRPPSPDQTRSWKDERAERNYRASEALNRFVRGDVDDDESPSGIARDAHAGVVFDAEPAQS